MTPAEKAVINAAESLYRGLTPAMVADLSNGLAQLLDPLVKRINELQDERETLPDSAAEKRRPWSEVVTEDEIYSTKTKKWYRVLSTVAAADNGRAYVKVQCEGMAKPFTVPAYAAVLVRRSEMGQAVDVWIDVMRSGPA